MSKGKAFLQLVYTILLVIAREKMPIPGPLLLRSSSKLNALVGFTSGQPGDGNRFDVNPQFRLRFASGVG